jgi:transcription antitermination factor NusG
VEEVSTASGEREIALVPEGEEWVILHTRPRAEKKAEQTLSLEGYWMYLPLRRKDHRYGGRHRVFWSPLFSGYLFGAFPSAYVHKLKGNQYVANVLRVADQVGLVGQLQQIQKALSTGALVDVMPYLEAGKPVRIIGGPFKGVEGIIERLDKKTKVVISIEMIQQSVFMEVDSAFVEMVT